MLDDQGPRGSGLPGITHEGYGRLMTGARRRAGTRPAPGSALIAVAAWLLALTGGGALFVSFSAQYAYILAVRRQDAASVIEALLLDLLMIVFTLLALGLSRAGQSARAERALILLCAAASAYMNVSAADLASPRSVTAYAVAPDHASRSRGPDRGGDPPPRPSRPRALGLDHPRPRHSGRSQDHWPGSCCTVLRFALAAPETARGLRRMVLDATPLPALPEAPDG